MHKKLLAFLLCTGGLVSAHAQISTDLKLFDLKGPVKEVTYDGSYLLRFCFLNDDNMSETFKFDRNGKWDEVLPDLFYDGNIEREDGKVIGISTEEIEIAYEWDYEDDLHTVEIKFNPDELYDFYTSVNYNYLPVDDGYKLVGTFISTRRDDAIEFSMTNFKYSGIDTNGNWTKCEICISTPDESGSYDLKTIEVCRTISYYQPTRDYSWLYGTWTSPAGSFMTDFKEGSLYIAKSFILESDSEFDYDMLYHSSRKSISFSGDYIYVDGKQKYLISFSKKTISSLDGKVVLTKMKNQEPPLSVTL